MGAEECLSVLREYIEKMEPSEPYHKSELGEKASAAVTELAAFVDNVLSADIPGEDN